MIDVIPVVLRLEIQNGANFVDISIETEDAKVARNRRPSKSSSLSMFPRKSKLPRPSATLEEGEATPPPTLSTESNRPNNRQCLGRRTYSEVVVESYCSKGDDPSDGSSLPSRPDTVQPSTSKSSIRSKTPSVMENVPDTLNFSCGNPMVEKTSGILHFYKNKSPVEIMRDNCWSVCMMEVPAFVTCTELIRFISPAAKNILEAKIIRDGIPNQYYVLVKFKSAHAAYDFYGEFNGASFNDFESSKCSLLFVEKIETATEGNGGSLPVDGLTELPSCAICLERLDDGVLTILCNHTFHAECLQHWEDTSCPVCRYHQTPELLPDQTCSECGKTTDLWMCLICGNIGCGRYASAHSYRHFETTSHTFTLQLGGNLVWDYAGDNYVHRLIQSSTDGKMVEFQGAEENKAEKMNAMEMEYSCLLSSQLEDQRRYFESKLKDMDSKIIGHKITTDEKIKSLETIIADTSKECDELKAKLEVVTTEKSNLEKKCAKSAQIIKKIQGELDEERQMSAMIRADKEELMSKTKELEQRRVTEVAALEEQVNDLMMHFDAQTRLSQHVKNEHLTPSELEGSNVVLGQKPSNKNSRRKK